MKWWCAFAIVLMSTAPAEAQQSPTGRVDATSAAAQSKAAPTVGERFRDCATCPEMVVVPSGTFTMGSPPGEEGREDAEGPQHVVTIAEPFAVGRTHITRGEYAAFVRETGHRQKSGCRILIGRGWSTSSSANWQAPGFDQDDRHPVVCIGWLDAIDYILWLSSKSGKQYRLLTEAEAEYIAWGRTSPAKTRLPFWFGDAKQACAYANGADQTTGRAVAVSPILPCNDGFVYTAPVGSFAPNAFGLHDVSGNVWTWTQDCANVSYDGAPIDGSAWMSGDCKSRVIRGGAWSSWPRYLRPSARDDDPLDTRDHRTGLRVARSL